jgi:hypothetical protein
MCVYACACVRARMRVEAKIVKINKIPDYWKFKIENEDGFRGLKFLLSRCLSVICSFCRSVTWIFVAPVGVAV